jgi:hypothetical protein
MSSQQEFFGAFGVAPDTLGAARRSLMDVGRWAQPSGVVCPCCDQRAKVYRRKLNSAMARSLIAIYRFFQKAGHGEWLNICQYLTYNVSVGDAAKLAYWDLIEPMTDAQRPDGSPRVGLYRATSTGWRFVRGEDTVPSHVVIYNAQVLGFSQERCTLRDALGEPFDYSELMQPVERIP